MIHPPCKTCRFWQRNPPGGDIRKSPKGFNPTGQCRHNPPMVGSDRWTTLFPITREIDWCGEHEEVEDG